MTNKIDNNGINSILSTLKSWGFKEKKLYYNTIQSFLIFMLPWNMGTHAIPAVKLFWTKFAGVEEGVGEMDALNVLH